MEITLLGDSSLLFFESYVLIIHLACIGKWTAHSPRRGKNGVQECSYRGKGNREARAVQEAHPSPLLAATCW